MANKIKVCFILALILFISGAFIALDWSRVFLFTKDIYHEYYTIVKILKLLTSAPELKEIITSITWSFYTPALVLLSLSSYKFK